MKIHMILFAAAPLVLGAGAFAYFAAPAEANKTTAVVIPSVIAAVLLGLGAAALLSKARWTKWAGVGACALFALLVAFPAVMRTDKMRNWPRASEAWQAAVGADPSLARRAASDRGVRKSFFDERKSPDHDQTYLIITLWSIVGVCGLSAVLVASGRTSAGSGRRGS